MGAASTYTSPNMPKRPLALLATAPFLVSFAAAAQEPAPLSAEETYRLVDALFSDSGKERRAARERLIEARDPSVAAALVEVLFFSPGGREDAQKVLRMVLGEPRDLSFKEWIEVVGRREDITPKPGYVAFKARQFSRIDPAFGEFLTEEKPRTIRPEEVVFGGVKKDGIPALRNPRRVAASEAGFLEDRERVFGISVAGQARAYPQRILDWHEMANDVLGGRTVTLSYCTLCGSGIAFDTTLADGETYTFGSSGLLYRSNKLMYDHQTQSLWSNLTGEPVWGSLVGKGKRLPILPMVVTTWGEWRSRHPTTDVLSLATGYTRDYRPGAAYGRYFASPDLMFRVWKKPPERLAPKDWIFSVEVDGVRKAYPIAVLKKERLLHDSVGGKEILLVTDPESEAVRAYRSRGRRFRLQAEGLRDVASGEVFLLEEDGLVKRVEGGTVATNLARLPGCETETRECQGNKPDAKRVHRWESAGGCRPADLIY